jgi:hypothetical protein
MGRDSTVALVQILDPRVTFDDDEVAPTYEVGRALAGVTVGLRLDKAWRSYMVVVEEWERMLRADGATPKTHVTGERVGEAGTQTRADLDEWARLVECGVVGLGN